MLAVVLASAALAEPVKNGFDLAGALIPPEAVESGGPPRDGIPSIDQPRFAPGTRVKFVRDEDRVLGVNRNGVAKAYPIRILNWHEIVNDTFGDERIAVTYCPLCGTGVAYVAEAGGRKLAFGVSGLLYNSDVLLYDRATQSLWSQLMNQAVAGPMKGARLTAIPLTHTTFADWRARHPDTLVLTPETGYSRDYHRDPYRGYESSAALFFKVSRLDKRHHPKELVIGLEVNGRFKAYPFAALERTTGDVRGCTSVASAPGCAPRATELRDTVGSRAVIVRFDPQNRTGAVHDAASGAEIPSVIAYWFAWYAFHPDTDVFESATGG
ncbi:DUF3179 domain-containing protein [Sulfuricaulis sp.]|uniref:DUF3179 domain-containing protein n=1 Tax=Sulfuricaulis sp. TaxID=2003553 RepID=UPI0034A2516E